ncbi:MAG: 7-cyano-7-deazaguanine synthase QueC [Chlamydiales bacterium]
MKKQAIVIHSGGMDSSICLALACREFEPENVLSLGFSYNQRHTNELKQAALICKEWEVDHIVLNLDVLQKITRNSLTDHQMKIEHREDQVPNSLVVGRNGLMVRIASIHANELGASCVYTGVIEVESSNSGYRDCSREYMDLMEKILRIDLANPHFEIRTPVVKMTKKETLKLADELGILDFLLKETITCYEGVPLQGCGHCPACVLRNQGILEYLTEHPDRKLPYQLAVQTLKN